MIILRDRDRAPWPYASQIVVLSLALGIGKAGGSKAGNPKNKKHLLAKQAHTHVRSF